MHGCRQLMAAAGSSNGLKPGLGTWEAHGVTLICSVSTRCPLLWVTLPGHSLKSSGTELSSQRSPIPVESARE